MLIQKKIIFVILFFILSASTFAFRSNIIFWKSRQKNPSALSLSHSANNRLFTVSWTAGSSNGGAGGCKLQFYKNSATWTDLTGTYNCDSNASLVAAEFPATDSWTNNFNSGGIAIRLVRISDSVVVGNFLQYAYCYVGSASIVSTPNVDEDCNFAWDNAGTQAAICSEPLATVSFGAAYSCPATTTCSGSPATFNSVAWNSNTMACGYVDSGCTNPWAGPPACSGSSSGYGSLSLTTQTGTVTSMHSSNSFSASAGSCHNNSGIYYLFPAIGSWDTGTCYYDYSRNVYY